MEGHIFKNRQQPDIIQRVRDIGILVLNRMPPSIPPFRDQGTHVEEEPERIYNSEGMGDTKKTRPSKSI